VKSIYIRLEFEHCHCCQRSTSNNFKYREQSWRC